MFCAFVGQREREREKDDILKMARTHEQDDILKSREGFRVLDIK